MFFYKGSVYKPKKDPVSSRPATSQKGYRQEETKEYGQYEVITLPSLYKLINSNTQFGNYGHFSMNRPKTTGHSQRGRISVGTETEKETISIKPLWEDDINKVAKKDSPREVKKKVHNIIITSEKLEIYPIEAHVSALPILAAPLAAPAPAQTAPISASADCPPSNTPPIIPSILLVLKPNDEIPLSTLSNPMTPPKTARPDEVAGSFLTRVLLSASSKHQDEESEYDNDSEIQNTFMLSLLRRASQMISPEISDDE
jgi:hypothetical protein